MLEVHLLGQFEILRDGKACPLTSRPAQSLLAYLLLNGNTPHRREKLAGLLWPEVPDNDARRNLRQALWQIRKAADFSDAFCLEADALMITFSIAETCQADAFLLKELCPLETTLDELIRILSSYQGELLPGFYEDWVTLEREHLQAIFEQGIRLLLDRLVESKRWEEVLDWGERWISLGHVPEPAYRALMIASKGLSDLSNVQAVFRRCQEAMRRDMGIEPSEQTRALHEQLLRDGPYTGALENSEMAR